MVEWCSAPDRSGACIAPRGGGRAVATAIDDFSILPLGEMYPQAKPSHYCSGKVSSPPKNLESRVQKRDLFVSCFCMHTSL